jgi:hypothetical protein
VDSSSENMLQGVFDLHTHGYPELVPGFGAELDDIKMATYARSRQMAGYVLKSHLWPTMDRAYHVRRQVPGLAVVPSIVLNTLVGGIQPGVLETAIIQGAGAAWFPTWSSENDLKRNGFSSLIRKLLPGLQPLMSQGLTVLAESGGLTPAASDVLRVAKEHGIVMGTGHLSAPEVLALAAEANRIGYERLVFTHPDSHSVKAADEAILEVARLGAYIEWTFVGMLPEHHRIKPNQVIEWIWKIGPGRCVLTTDTFGPAPLLEPDLFQLYLGTLRNLGMSHEDLQVMAVKNPTFLARDKK